MMCGVYAKSCVACMQFFGVCSQFCGVCIQFLGVCMQFYDVCMQFLCYVYALFCGVCMQFLWCVHAVFECVYAHLRSVGMQVYIFLDNRKHKIA